MSMSSTVAVELRHPVVEDGPLLWSLARDTAVLDLNSRYAYVAHCRHFAATSVVASTGGGPDGFVTGYRLPGAPDTLFVWQVGVAQRARGRGLATRMLRWLLSAPGNRDTAWLHTTVTPSNEPSRRLFRGLAQRLDAPCIVEPCFGAELLGQGHEPEELFRIGPIPRSP